MSTIVTRSGKGSPLTHTEVDDNFTNLNTDKYQEGSAIGETTPAAGTFTTLTATGQSDLGTGSANYLSVTGAASSANLFTTGSSTNVSMFFRTKGTGAFNFTTNNSFSTQQFSVTHTASAVNYVQVTGAATGGSPTISAQGSDATAALTLTSKGAANVNFQIAGTTRARVNGDASVDLAISGSGGVGFKSVGVSSQVNFLQSTGAVAGNSPILAAQGSDTNIDLTLTTKGTGAVNLNTGGGTQVKVLDTTTSGSAYWTMVGSSGGYPFISVDGTNPNINAVIASKGIGAVRFSTNGTSGPQQFMVSHTASAVNYVQVTGNATGGGPSISAQGSDTNVSMYYIGKGIGGHVFTSGSGANIQFVVNNTTSAVNYVQVTGAATGNQPVISAQGSDANLPLRIASKGTQVVTIATNYSGSGTGNAQFNISHTSNSVNILNVTGAATGAAPVLSAQGSDTNIPLVLQPKGTGALQAQQTDSTSTGGNARGANAVDWQTSRNAATQVASGSGSFIGAGTRNASTGGQSFVGGGYTNSASGGNQPLVVSGAFNTANSTNYPVVVGGISNNATNDYTFIGGGSTNTAAGFFNFIGAGQTNSGTSGSAVTTQGSTITSGSTAVTLSGSNSAIKVGQLISGTGITGSGSVFNYVAAISGTSLTLASAAAANGTPTLSFFTPHGVVVGGGNNQATGSYSFIGGGGDAGNTANRNTASGDWSTIAGGNKNTASGKGAFIGGNGGDGAAFYGNIASGISSAIVCGTNNTVTSTAGFVGAGVSHNNTGAYGFLGAGIQNSVNSTGGSISGGFNGNTRSIAGNHVFPACANPVANASGVSQTATLVLGRQTTDATPAVLASDSTTPSTINQVILPNNSAYYFKGTVVAGKTAGGDTKGWTIEGVIKRGANAASTTVVGVTVMSSYGDAGAVTWTIAAAADTTNGGLKITATGQAATTIRWVCKIETTEMTF
jgi:hypothetical protein